MRISLALFDTLLNSWDECFHGVVAKNFTKHWLTPTLYDSPLISMGNGWVEGNIWLHKQPLFLWQMALSIKMLGTSVFAARLPSVLMSTIQIYFIYSIGVQVMNKKVGYYAALIYAIAYYPLALVSGAACNDHNDVAFVFYVCASCWAWFNYSKAKEWKWVFAIGVFAGMAVLVKWLAGILVFGGWGMAILTDKEIRVNIKNYVQIGVAFLCCLTVFLPWQFYIFQVFPQAAQQEFALISQHFNMVVELHDGPWYYYLKTMKDIYPFGLHLGPILVLVSLMFLLKALSNRAYSAFILSSIVFVYVFFSVAATKMASFVFIVSPFIFIAIGSVMHWLFERSKSVRYSQFKYVVLVFAMVGFFNIPQHYKDHYGNGKKQVFAEYKKKLDGLNSRFKEQDVVLFNVSYLDATQLMFFTDMKVYTIIPKPEQLDKIYSLQKTPVIINAGNLPDYILNDTRIVVLNDFRFPSL